MPRTTLLAVLGCSATPAATALVSRFTTSLAVFAILRTPSGCSVGAPVKPAFKSSFAMSFLLVDVKEELVGGLRVPILGALLLRLFSCVSRVQPKKDRLG
jgi:hypothetical protein